MRLSAAGRIGLAALGILAILAGLFWWQIESQTSSLRLEEVRYQNGVVEVWEAHADVPDRARGDAAALRALGATLQFTGTDTEAAAYIEQRQAAERSYLLAGAIIGLGVVVAAIAFIPARRRREEEPRVPVG